MHSWAGTLAGGLVHATPLPPQPNKQPTRAAATRQATNFPPQKASPNPLNPEPPPASLDH